MVQLLLHAYLSNLLAAIIISNTVSLKRYKKKLREMMIIIINISKSLMRKTRIRLKTCKQRQKITEEGTEIYHS